MSGNQRQAFRFRFPANKQAGKLSLGNETIKIRLVDQSASGFSVLTPAHPLATSDGILRLETMTAAYEVRVINLVQEKGEYRLGLSLISEIADSRKKASLSAWSPAAQSGDRINSKVLPITLGLLLAVGVVLILVAALDLFVPTSVTLESKNPLVGETNSTLAQEPTPVRSPRSSKANTAARENSELQQRVDLLGAAVFMMPDVAKRLELTPQQIKNISRIVQKTAAAESQLASSGNDGKPNPARSRDLLRQSRDEARNLLNPDQAKQWDALLGE